MFASSLRKKLMPYPIAKQFGGLFRRRSASLRWLLHADFRHQLGRLRWLIPIGLVLLVIASELPPDAAVQIEATEQALDNAIERLRSHLMG
jgi:hypothetical protein